MGGGHVTSAAHLGGGGDADDGDISGRHVVIAVGVGGGSKRGPT